jgi:hypothetical protein
MDQRHSRRSFFTIAAALGGAACLGRCAFAMGEVEDEELKALREQLAIEFQKRQVRDRMVLFEKLIAKYGKGIIVDVEKSTIEETRKRLAEADLEKRDLDSVKAFLWDQLGEGFTFSCIEDSPTRLEYKVTRCFLAEEVAKYGMPELGAAFYCAWDVGFCQGLNPNIVFKRTKTLMRGDACCNHRYELET